MLTGKSLRADKAKKMGIVDLLVDKLGPGLALPEENTRRYLEETAILVAKDLASGKLNPVRGPKALPEKIFKLLLSVNWVKEKVFEKARGQVMKMSGGLYPAPLKVNYFN